MGLKRDYCRSHSGLSIHFRESNVYFPSLTHTLGGTRLRALHPTNWSCSVLNTVFTVLCRIDFCLFVCSGLQVVMKSIIRAISPLLQICLLVGFVIVLYAIIGMQFLNGAFHYVCTENGTSKYLPVFIK